MLNSISGSGLTYSYFKQGDICTNYGNTLVLDTRYKILLPMNGRNGALHSKLRYENRMSRHSH